MVTTELREKNLQLYLLLTVSFAVKIFYIFLLTDYHDYLFSDFGGYWDRALERLSGNSNSVNQWIIWPPFGHILLTEVLRLIYFFGLDSKALQIVLAINVLLSTATAYMIYYISIKLFNHHSFGLTVAFIYAFCFPLVYFNAFVMSEHPSIFFVVFSLFILLNRNEHKFIILSGLLLAIGVAIRPAFGLLGGVFFVYILFRDRISTSSVIKGAIFSFSFFAVLLLVLIEVFTISDGKLKGLSANGGLTYYFAQCKTYRVDSVFDNYHYVIVPPATVEHPENGTLVTNHPFYDQSYFYDLGKKCVEKNPHIWLENLANFKTLFFGPLLPSIGSAFGFSNLLPISRHILFIMTISLIYLPFLIKSTNINRPLLYLLYGVIVTNLLTLYFFNSEHRYLYSMLFAIFPLSILSFYLMLAKNSSGKEYLLFSFIVILAYTLVNL